jgi:uncharacterized protein YjiS (DUF1127 family)
MKEWFKKVLASMIEARQRQANARIAEMHLWRMTDRELNDIGIGRGDIKRVVYETENEVKTKKQGTNSPKNKNNVSWRQYIYSKLGWELHKANHA